jgi:hypothetical protein
MNYTARNRRSFFFVFFWKIIMSGCIHGALGKALGVCGLGSQTKGSDLKNSRRFFANFSSNEADFRGPLRRLQRTRHLTSYLSQRKVFLSLCPLCAPGTHSHSLVIAPSTLNEDHTPPFDVSHEAKILLELLVGHLHGQDQHANIPTSGKTC